jgi:hypothetical protein
MRRYLFAVLASLALIAAVPAESVARSHHRARHHRRHDRIEHFRPKHTVASNVVSPDVGTVQSFASNVLTIKLNDGSLVSGRVTPDTEVECMAMDLAFQRHDGGPSTSGGGNDGQNGGDNGDNGDQGNRGDQGNLGDEGDQGQGDQGDQGDRDDAAEDNGTCLTALQTPGTKVREATLRLTGSGRIWDRIDLDS